MRQPPRSVHTPQATRPSHETFNHISQACRRIGGRERRGHETVNHISRPVNRSHDGNARAGSRVTHPFATRYQLSTAPTMGTRGPGLPPSYTTPAASRCLPGSVRSLLCREHRSSPAPIYSRRSSHTQSSCAPRPPTHSVAHWPDSPIRHPHPVTRLVSRGFTSRPVTQPWMIGAQANAKASRAASRSPPTAGPARRSRSGECDGDAVRRRRSAEYGLVDLDTEAGAVLGGDPAP